MGMGWIATAQPEVTERGDVAGRVEEIMAGVDIADLVPPLRLARHLAGDVQYVGIQPAGQAARHRQESQVAALSANQSALQAAPRGTAEFMRANEEFHTLIADASGNRPLAALWSALAAIADGQEAGVRYTPAVLGAMIAAHRKICDAIIAGDADEAIRSMTLHLEATRDYVARYYPAIIDTTVMLVTGVP